MLKAVIFDIDGVLIDSRRHNTDYFQRLLTSAGYRRPARSTVDALFHLPLIKVLRTLLPKAKEDEIKRIKSMAATVPLAPELLRVTPDVRGFLRNLRPLYKLGIVTSRLHFGLDPVLRSLRTPRLIGAAIGYEDCPTTKPHPEPLLLAAKRLRVAADDAVYIGDAHSDWLAARRAGMRFILFGPEAIVRCRYRARDFEQLGALIAQIAET